MKCEQPKMMSQRVTARGFTLVEMLVAMAVTLIMMAALARSFGFVGNQVRDGRADTQLSNQLRDVSTRLSDEIDQCTVTLEPASASSEPNGYFMYYEGPVTDATSSLFRAADTTDGVFLDAAKFGDFDDYLAFTASAPAGQWFTGKVPRYILEMKTAELAGTGYTLPTVPADLARAFEPVVIRSKYAEIVYFASPEYAPVSLPATPAYIDVDGDLDLGSGSAIENGIPDRLKIHRRVLLIRPDLNLTSGALPIQTFDSIPFMQADTWPTASTATIVGAANAADGWLYGMAGVHQQCDLSIRRIDSAAGTPTVFVAANSLGDLSKPQNRFAHVRIPNRVLTGSGTANFPTSMPVLALGNAPTILSTATSNSPARIAPPATPNVGPVVTPASMSGFLRPEFVLGNDRSHLDSATDLWGGERLGEDLLVNNSLAFDVQVFDPNAIVVDTSDLSAKQSDVMVGPSDAGYREAIRTAFNQVSTDNSGSPSVPTSIVNYSERGAFVDLCYPVLAGGSLRGWQARRIDRRDGTGDGALSLPGLMITPFTGVASYSTTPADVYQPSLFKSGKLVTFGTSIRLFQPTFDTFTNSYERDGFAQATLNASSNGTVWENLTGATTVDLGSNGIDDDATFGADDFAERETSPPFINTPDAIRITVRVENPKTRQIRQISIVHRD
ncbi:prepilin-type N-terminal cleavage/methylation domain-containing protein [Rubripirellula obstinata]|nr:prepilin-type N-terminal cleavage/methylation domain-containing protein [Rubripirellula obstinata]